MARTQRRSMRLFGDVGEEGWPAEGQEAAQACLERAHKLPRARKLRVDREVAWVEVGGSTFKLVPRCWEYPHTYALKWSRRPFYIVAERRRLHVYRKCLGIIILIVMDEWPSMLLH